MSIENDIIRDCQNIKGDNYYVMGSQNIIYGDLNEIIGFKNIISGNKNVIKSKETTVCGNSNFIYGQKNIITGEENQIYGDNSVINGNRNNVNSDSSTIYGNSNILCGYKNVVYGNNNKIFGDDNRISGKNNEVIGKNNFINNHQETNSLENLSTNNRIHNDNPKFCGVNNSSLHNYFIEKNNVQSNVEKNNVQNNVENNVENNVQNNNIISKRVGNINTQNNDLQLCKYPRITKIEHQFEGDIIITETKKLHFVIKFMGFTSTANAQDCTNVVLFNLTGFTINFLPSGLIYCIEPPYIKYLILNTNDGKSTKINFNNYKIKIENCDVEFSQSKKIKFPEDLGSNNFDSLDYFICFCTENNIFE